MERCPNFNVDISARLGELGRQPYTARQFFANYADRILFGLDLGPHLPSYRISYRLLETDDEYFNYNDSEVPLQGRWYAYGLYLEEDILEKVYRKNAERLILKKS
jgi:predicted TIM-barrel fold metal-dependent hydrolase